MLAYKAAKHGNTRVLSTLEIPEDALTNLKRSSIANAETAKYRCNKAKVLKIEDDEGKTYETAETLCFNDKSLTYKVGEVVEESSYVMDQEQVCSAGIHFFLSRDVAYRYERPKPKNGLYQSWYNNGQKYEEVIYKDGKMEGLYQKWHENGQKYEEVMYKDGKSNGLYQSWYRNGQKYYEMMYKDGKMEGLYQSVV
jgi:Family of unknown function (DUF5758)/MORN repeat variant